MQFACAYNQTPYRTDAGSCNRTSAYACPNARFYVCFDIKLSSLDYYDDKDYASVDDYDVNDASVNDNDVSDDVCNDYNDVDRVLIGKSYRKYPESRPVDNWLKAGYKPERSRSKLVRQLKRHYSATKTRRKKLQANHFQKITHSVHQP